MHTQCMEQGQHWVPAGAWGCPLPWLEGFVHMGTGLGSHIAQEMFTCRGVQERTYPDEVSGIAVLFGGEVVEISHVLILGRETQRRATFHLLPSTQ